MFKKFTNGCVRVVNRWLPDPFLFAIILTIVVFIGAMIGTQQTPMALVDAWGNDKGFWGCCPSPCRWPWFWSSALPWRPPRSVKES